jgi:hypothetical protein
MFLTCDLDILKVAATETSSAGEARMAATWSSVRIVYVLGILLKVIVLLKYIL